MSHSHSHSPTHDHSHGHSHAPETKGFVLHQARLYNLVFSRLTRKSNPTILAIASIKPGSTVLDVGCGPGGLTIDAKKRAGPGGEVFGLDASVEMIEEARRMASKAHLAVNFEAGLAEKMPYEDGKFDVVLSRLAFHHLPGELLTSSIAEIYRVLKPGGVCMVVDFDPNTVPHFSYLRLHFKPGHPIMKVDTGKYVPLLEAAGFKAVEYAPTGHAMLNYVKGVK